MEKQKFRILWLCEDPSLPDPWTESGQTPPKEAQIEPLALLKSHVWADTPHYAQVLVVLVDLDVIARTHPLDQWALQAWRASFSDLILRAMGSEGRAATLLGFTREPSWERAQLGVQIGARELVKLSRLNEHLTQLIQSSPDKNLSVSDIKFGSPETKTDMPGTPNVIRFKSSQPQTGASHSDAKHDVQDTLADYGLDTPAIIEAPSIPKHVIPFPIEGLDGTSHAIEGVRELIRRTAPLETPVLILGQTGTGKELVARCLHKYSARRQGPFVTLNCGAVSPNLIESELFGHVRGAFTDATQDNEGVIRSANGGTLFLDEIAHLSPDIQVKLLRVIQDHKITPVGSSQRHDIDVRIISATQEDLSELVSQGKFREDLMFRIRVIELSLPSLVERKSDIPDICRVVLRKLARKHKKSVLEIADSAMEKFLLHNWPGNIRELENVLEHAATLAWAENRKEIELNHLPESIRFVTMQSGKEQQLKDAVKRFEKEYIAATIRRMGGSKEEAATVLGLSLATLYRKLGS